jgi:hypothetical protein
LDIDLSTYRLFIAQSYSDANPVTIASGIDLGQSLVIAVDIASVPQTWHTAGSLQRRGSVSGLSAIVDNRWVGINRPAVINFYNIITPSTGISYIFNPRSWIKNYTLFVYIVAE